MGERPMLIKLDVLRSWDGVDRQEFVLHTSTNSMSCEGYNFRAGDTYLVVAIENRPEAGASWPPPGTSGVLHCGVWQLKDAKDVTAELDHHGGS
jgi:hypothetical protein